MAACNPDPINETSIPVTEQGNQERSVLVLPNHSNERDPLLPNHQQQQQVTEQQQCLKKKNVVVALAVIVCIIIGVPAIVIPLTVTDKCKSETAPVYSFKTALINTTDIDSACGEPTLHPNEVEQRVHLYQSKCSSLKCYNRTLVPPADSKPVKNRTDPLPMFFEFLSSGSIVEVEISMTLKNKPNGADIPVCTFDDVKRLKEELDLGSEKKWDRSYALHCSYIGSSSQIVLNWRETIRFNKTSYYVIVIYPLQTLELINYTYTGWTYALNYSDYADRELDCSAPKGCSSNTSCVIASADPAGSPSDFVDVQIQPPKWNKYTIPSLTVGIVGFLACIAVIGLLLVGRAKAKLCS